MRRSRALEGLVLPGVTPAPARAHKNPRGKCQIIRHHPRGLFVYVQTTDSGQKSRNELFGRQRNHLPVGGRAVRLADRERALVKTVKHYRKTGNGGHITLRISSRNNLRTLDAQFGLSDFKRRTAVNGRILIDIDLNRNALCIDMDARLALLTFAAEIPLDRLSRGNRPNIGLESRKRHLIRRRQIYLLALCKIDIRTLRLVSIFQVLDNQIVHLDILAEDDRNRIGLDINLGRYLSLDLKSSDIRMNLREPDIIFNAAGGQKTGCSYEKQMFE